jgi:hypothetical protein
VLPSGRQVLVLDDAGVVSAYRRARYPRPSREEVEPLGVSEEVLARLTAVHCRE